MSDRVSEFLVDLASNPDRMAAFHADPDRVFDEVGLTFEQQVVIRSRDPRLLSRIVSESMRLQDGHETAIRRPEVDVNVDIGDVHVEIERKRKKKHPHKPAKKGGKTAPKKKPATTKATKKKAVKKPVKKKSGKKR
jgi:hypothetical protein